jgi:hypothetical protein
MHALLNQADLSMNVLFVCVQMKLAKELPDALIQTFQESKAAALFCVSGSHPLRSLPLLPRCDDAVFRSCLPSPVSSLYSVWVQLLTSLAV